MTPIKRVTLDSAGRQRLPARARRNEIGVMRCARRDGAHSSTRRGQRLARHVLSIGRMFDAFASVSSLQGALDYHMERHNLLVSNIAHVDTPGYRPVDLAREADAFGQMLG